MSYCIVCELDSENHSKHLWERHRRQLVSDCVFCKKSSLDHSKKSWQMHMSVVKKAAGGRKIYHVQTYGRIKPYPGLLQPHMGNVSTYDTFNWKGVDVKEIIPIFMSCTECGRFLGSAEEDLCAELDGTCITCFREMTGQTHYWYDIPPALKPSNKQDIDHTKIDRGSTIRTLTSVPEEEKNG